MIRPGEWEPICEAIARTASGGIYFPGAEDADVVQEARFGVWKAIRDFRPDGGASFETFAYMCARRQVMAALTAANREKHRVLTEASALDAPLHRDDGADGTVADLIVRYDSDPARIVIARDQAFRLLGRMRLLSPLERECVERVLIGGESYEAVGPAKRVDNALARARRKLAAGEALAA